MATFSMSAAMLSRIFSPISSRLSLVAIRNCSTSAERDTYSLFLQSNVQKELKQLTGKDYDKIFRVRKVGQEVKAPVYQFLTQEELEEKMKETDAKAQKKLQMPPVMDARKPVSRVLEDDPALRGYDAAKYVFTDITYGIHERQRLIVVREPDGVLRTAEWEERDRLNQAYFPQEGRKIRIPDMFEPSKLSEILSPDRYMYILDRNCVQFNPDHPVYIRTCHAVYNHIDENGHYSVLHSSRHYGPMVFYFATNKMCDGLLISYLKNFDMDSVFSLVRLYGHLHPDSSVADPGLTDEDRFKLYVKNEATKAGKIQMAYEAMKEVQEKVRRAKKSSMDAHIKS